MPKFAWGGELNQSLSRVCHPTVILDSQLGTVILHLSLDQRNREEVQHQKEDTVGWSKGRSWGIHVGHRHFNEPCPSLQVNKELEFHFPKRNMPSHRAHNTEKLPFPSCVEETHVLGKRKERHLPFICPCAALNPTLECEVAAQWT